MCCGKPCLVSDIEQHREIREVCPTLVVVEDDITEWEKKIRFFQSMSKQELNDIGTSNRNNIRNSLSLEKMHDDYNKIYFKRVK